MDLITIEQYDSYLEHHGILGQKWGKRQGPPYPLGASDHSAAKKKAGWRDSLNKIDRDKNRQKAEAKRSSSSDGKKRGLSDNQKRALMVGAAVAGTALAAYGAYKFKDYVDSDTIERARKAVYSVNNESRRKLMDQVIEPHVWEDRRLQSLINEQVRYSRLANEAYGSSSKAYQHHVDAVKQLQGIRTSNAIKFNQQMTEEAARISGLMTEAKEQIENEPFVTRAGKAIASSRARRTRRG